MQWTIYDRNFHNYKFRLPDTSYGFKILFLYIFPLSLTLGREKHQTTIIYLSSISQLTYVTVTFCVFFYVRNEYLNIINTSFSFKGLITP